MGRLIVIGVIAAALVFALTNLGLFNRGNSDNPGFRVAEASSNASAHAGKLIRVFDSVNPHSVPVNPPGPGSDAAPNPAGDVGANIPEIVSPADTAVKDAYNWMVYYANQSAVDSQHKYIEAASALKNEWEPRYNAARQEYNKLNHQVEFSKKTADEYFAIQRGLTDEIQDAEVQSQLRESDRLESDVYDRWAEQADKTVLMEIMQDLEDMDVIMQKQICRHTCRTKLECANLPASMTAL